MVDTIAGYSLEKIARLAGKKKEKVSKVDLRRYVKAKGIRMVDFRDAQSGRYFSARDKQEFAVVGPTAHKRVWFARIRPRKRGTGFIIE